MTQKLDEVLNNYIDALAAQSSDTASEFFHEKATVIFAEGTYHGKASIRAAFSKTFSIIKDEFFDIKDLRWNLQNEQFASCTFCFKWEGTLNGNRFMNPGRGTLVWVCDNGKWLIINEHFGPMPR